MLYAIRPTSQLQGDLFIEDGEDTYICTLNPAWVDADIAIEQQPIWRIQKVAHTTTSSGARTQILYPQGDTEFAYAPAEINNYNFAYRK